MTKRAATFTGITIGLIAAALVYGVTRLTGRDEELTRAQALLPRSKDTATPQERTDIPGAGPTLLQRLKAVPAAPRLSAQDIQLIAEDIAKIGAGGKDP